MAAFWDPNYKDDDELSRIFPEEGERDLTSSHQVSKKQKKAVDKLRKEVEENREVRPSNPVLGAQVGSDPVDESPPMIGKRQNSSNPFLTPFSPKVARPTPLWTEDQEKRRNESLAKLFRNTSFDLNDETSNDSFPGKTPKRGGRRRHRTRRTRHRSHRRRRGGRSTRRRR